MTNDELDKLCISCPCAMGVATKNPPQGTTSRSLKTCSKTAKMTVATKNSSQGTTSREDDSVAEDDCRIEESIARDIMPVAEDEFQDDKDDSIEFFLRPRGQQLDKDNCYVTEDKYRQRIHRKAPQAYHRRQAPTGQR
jgi:hypothetical protein